MSATDGKRERGGRRSGIDPRKLSPCTPEEACQILFSAVMYCQKAGFQVRAGNRESGLVIVIPGAKIEHSDAGTTIRPCQHDAGTDTTA